MACSTSDPRKLPRRPQVRRNAIERYAPLGTVTTIRDGERLYGFRPFPHIAAHHAIFSNCSTTHRIESITIPSS